MLRLAENSSIAIKLIVVYVNRENFNNIENSKYDARTICNKQKTFVALKFSNGLLILRFNNRWIYYVDTSELGEKERVESMIALCLPFYSYT